MRKSAPLFLLRFFRLDRSEELWFPAMILAALGVLIYAVLLQQSSTMADEQLKICREVLAGAAGWSFQASLLTHAKIMYWIYNLRSNPTSHYFAQIYTVYCGLGMALFLILLFRLCRRVASTVGSTLACLYLIGVYPIMLFDNYYQPGDPWGAMLAVLMIEVLLANRSRIWYYILLFLSGLIWIRIVLFPVSVGLSDLKSNKKLMNVIGMTALACLLAAAGQIGIRLILHVNDIMWTKYTWMQEIVQLPRFFMRGAAVFGMQIYFMITHPRKVPFLFIALSLQFLVWPILHFALRGGMAEIRGIFIMVPYTWPVLAMFFDHIISGQTSKTQV